MNYQKHYDLLINKGQSRKLDVYFEKHHIVPKCIGGTNDPENLVELTAEEHYIAHMLLAKIYFHVPPILNAAAMMAARNNKAYGWIMREHAKITSARFKGVPKSADQKKKQSEAKKLKLEYKGKIYNGFSHLTEETKVTYHLYNKYYLNGVDPEKYIGNNTYAMIEKVKTNPSKPAANKKWYNNGSEERYSDSSIDGWQLGRLIKKRDNLGRYKGT
jgi:hypothetical protein